MDGLEAGAEDGLHMGSSAKNTAPLSHSAVPNEDVLEGGKSDSWERQMARGDRNPRDTYYMDPWTHVVKSLESG